MYPASVADVNCTSASCRRSDVAGLVDKCAQSACFAWRTSPDVLEHACRGFGLYASPNRKVAPELRELGQTRAGWLVGSQFVFSQHCKACRAYGFAPEKIEAIKA